MKATLYKTLSNQKTPIEVPEGATVREALPDLDLENAIVVVNGRIERPDYTLKQGDIVTVRLTPSATGLLVTAIVVAVLAVGAGIAGGIVAYKAIQAAEKAEEELEKAKKLSNQPDIDNRPFLRGATNTLATGNSQPYIIGRHFFTPYLLCKPFYKITGTDGANEYTYTALECGFNKQILQSLSIDDIAIKTFTDASPQEGAYGIDAGIFAEDGLLEVSQDGGLLTALPELNYKVVSESCNDEIPHDSDVSAGTEEHLTYTLDPHAKDVDVAITFPYGLYAVNDKGDKIETETTITPQYSLDGGKSWTNFTFNNNGAATNTFKRNISTKELRFVAHRDFTAADYAALKRNGQSAIYLRLRNGGSSGDSRIKNDCFCLFHQSVCFDPNKSTGSELTPCKVVEDRERAFCTTIGLKLKASKINEDKLKKINVVTQGVARTWDGERWSAGRSATRNPAAWALEVLTSDSHPMSRYADEEIDLEGFGEWYEWCEANGYKYDQAITQSTKKDDTLQKICEATGAAIYLDIYGRKAVAVDRPQENALAVYNSQNIIKIQNKKTFGRRTDGLRIKYVNSKDDLYQEDTYLVMREVNGEPLPLNEDSVIKDLTVTGITEHEHIVKHARRLMAIEALRPKTTTIEVGNEGVFYTPLSKVLIQDDSLKIGLGSATIRECQWRGGLLKKILINGRLNFHDPLKAYGVIVNCWTEDGATPVAIKVEGSGETDELTVLSQVRQSADAVPEANCVLSFGELDANGEFTRITTPYIISQIKRGEKGFNLELVNYNEAVYDSGAIPDYTSNITMKRTEGKNTIPPDYATKGDVEEAVQSAVGSFEVNADAANELAELVTKGVNFSSTHFINPLNRGSLENSLNLEELERRLDEVLAEVNAGIEMTDERITIAVRDKERDLYSAIELTKDGILQVVHNGDAGLETAIRQTADEILAQADETERELRALLSVQAGAVQAMVEGGGAAGRMSLSLELPVMIDANTRAKMVKASSESAVSAVYAKLDGTDYYAIKGNAGDAAVKALWDKAVAAGLIASQVVIDADQINIAGKTVYTSNKTNAVAATAASSAQSAAAGDAMAKQNAIATSLGYESYDKMAQAAKNKQSIIDGGHIRTSLIEADALAAEIAKIDQVISKKIQSDNYQHGKSGFMLDGATGEAHLEGNTHIGGNCTIDGKGTIGANVTIEGMIKAKNIEFLQFSMGSIPLGYAYASLVGNVVAHKEIDFTFMLKGQAELRVTFHTDYIGSSFTIYKTSGDSKTILYSYTSEVNDITLNISSSKRTSFEKGDVVSCEVDDVGRVKNTYVKCEFMTDIPENSLLYALMSNL